MISNEIFPEKLVIEAVIENAIIPRLKVLKKDLGSLFYKCSVYIENNEVFATIIDDNGFTVTEDNVQNIRIRFRPISVKNKLRFYIEAVYSEEVSPQSTGFSGFEISGSINFKDLSIKCPNWIIRYNVWKWLGWWF